MAHRRRLVGALCLMASTIVVVTNAGEATYNTPPPPTYGTPPPPPPKTYQTPPPPPPKTYETPSTTTPRTYQTPAPRTYPPNSYAPPPPPPRQTYGNDECSGPNTCGPNQQCVRDYSGQQKCQCLPGFVGISGSQQSYVKTSLICKRLVNECSSKDLNDCSINANCVDTFDSYTCKCKPGFIDSNPSNPGRQCDEEQQPKNLCDAGNNDCDANAQCIPEGDYGYTCKCNLGYCDISSGKGAKPGRQCKKVVNECADQTLNKCDKNAECFDTCEGYTCRCKEGFYDGSHNPADAGHQCIAYAIPETISKVEKEEPACKAELGEVLLGGRECTCKPGETRKTPQDKCQALDKIPLAIRVTSKDGEPLIFSSEYADDKSPVYVEIARVFDNDTGKAIHDTEYAPRYVTTDVSLINHPRTVNASWPDGLLVNFTVGVTKGEPVDKCKLWDELMESIQRTNGAIGGGKLQVAPDVDLLDPCPPPRPKCGDKECNEELGEVCIANSVCGCPPGQKRASPKDKCVPVESWVIPLWVIRRNFENIKYNQTFANPLDDTNKEYVRLFQSGVGQSYPNTELKNAFVVAEVNDIVEPATVNSTWDSGILVNATFHFKKGSVRIPSDAYNVLVRYIIDRNNYQIGRSGLYISPYQTNPFSACWKNDCAQPGGICIETGPNSYRCECAKGYVDKTPANPGHSCRPTHGYNECEHPEDNDCSENARCIDLEYLYRCECLKGFKDESPKGSLPGSVCVADSCQDVNFCPANTTCVNREHGAECICLPGYVDIKNVSVDVRVQAGLTAETVCLNPRDVNECLLGLHNCSSIAICHDLPIGYTCECPAGYLDGNPALPGRLCAAALCDLCNGHGDCVTSATTGNVTCACTEGYSGQFCEVSPSIWPLLLMLFLALLFLLLTLCCLLYLCSKCRCFRRKPEPAFTHLDSSMSSGDIYIPRAKLRDDSMSLGSGSEGTIIEEIDRRIITEVTTQEMRSSAEHGAEEYSEMSASHQAHFAEGGEEAADYEHETRDVHVQHDYSTNVYGRGGERHISHGTDGQPTSYTQTFKTETRP